MNYPEADRYIPTTPALLSGWSFSGCTKRCDKCGGTNIRVHCTYCYDDPGNDHACNDGCRDCGGDYSLCLDPIIDAVRDHLIRRLSLPAWTRDGAGLEPWQSAGLIACAAAGVVPTELVPAWVHEYGHRWTRRHGVEWIVVSHEGWWLTGTAPHVIRGPETGEPGKLAADAAALAHGCSLMLDADTMALPWPGGPRVWRKP